jgi:hypothetical protein
LNKQFLLFLLTATLLPCPTFMKTKKKKQKGNYIQ